ncbi:MAG TPA: GGDEF domain-containing protein [Kaistiaceae bacterium]|nr:GGDEF domain-containing protein [Kaistiaceae bacterium]
MFDVVELKRTLSYAENALGQLKISELPAYPRNYELWYTYAAGFNHDLNKSVNEILRARGRLTSEETGHLYDQFLSPLKVSDRVEQVGNRMSDEVSEILALVESALGETHTLNQSLRGATKELSRTEDRDTVKAIVADLIATTKSVEANNRKLEGKLAESKRQIDELQQNLEAIRFESLTDPLTTLANRKCFDMSIERELTIARESGEPLSLLLTDIDHFKKFNDTWGHQTGDQVLRLVAMALKQNVKGRDIACRYGGEEFAVVLPKTNSEQAVAVAEHIRMAVMSKELVKRSTGENLGRITISIGAATYREGDSVQTLIERSDSCLYAAKRGGRNQTKSDAGEIEVAA